MTTHPDITLAAWSARSYAEPATVETEDAHCLIGTADDVQILALRGTNPEHLVDIYRDVAAIEVRHDAIFGVVSDSFLSDAEQLVYRVWHLLRDPFWITGHSKGAADAQGLAAILTFMGRPPARLTTFAAPGMGLMGGILATTPGIDYFMQHDGIPDMPYRRGHPRPFVLLPWAGATVPLDRIVCHAMTGPVTAYDAAVARYVALLTVVPETVVILGPDPVRAVTLT